MKSTLLTKSGIPFFIWSRYKTISSKGFTSPACDRSIDISLCARVHSHRSLVLGLDKSVLNPRPCKILLMLIVIIINRGFELMQSYQVGPLRQRLYSWLLNRLMGEAIPSNNGVMYFVHRPQSELSVYQFRL